MLTRCIVVVGALFISHTSFAAEPVTLTIDSLVNVSGSGALEACGTATHKDGLKPLMVTVKHDESFYTTLTAPNGKWCVIFKRWTFNGEIDASATTLTQPGKVDFRSFKVSLTGDHT